MCGIILFIWAGRTAEMVGDTLREVAALICIFLPLEFWRDKNFGHLTLVEHAALWASGTFLLGLFSGYASDVFYRIKKDLEGPRETSRIR